jgi:hypothetical protein
LTLVDVVEISSSAALSRRSRLCSGRSRLAASSSYTNQQGTEQHRLTALGQRVVRELQNVIERAVVLCDGETFSIDETWLKADIASAVWP